MSEERRWGDGPEACPLGGASGGDGTGGTGREGWSLHAAPLLPRPRTWRGRLPPQGATSPPPQATPPSCLLVLWLRNVQDRNNQLSPSSSGGHLGPVWPPSPENTPPYPGEFYLKQRLFPLS